MSLPRLAVLCDLVEENWPSMDLVGEMLCSNLRRNHADSISVTSIRPPMRRRFTRIAPPTWRSAFNADRLVNRMWDYTRMMHELRGSFDLFHIVDHSYGQLVNYLPGERSVVTCHDLDAFRCLWDKNGGRKNGVLRMVAKYTLAGLGKAARVVCVSNVTREELLEHGLQEPERVVVIPNGVHPACSPEADANADAVAARLLGSSNGDAIYILHVGSTIPRKRVDVLLRTLVSVWNEVPHVRLVRVGGSFTREQKRLIDELRLDDSITVLPYLDRKILAAVYRCATLVLQPSEREGFGLPVVEAMACGTPVVASDLPVLREVAGDAAVFSAVGDIKVWSESVVQLLNEKVKQPEEWNKRKAKGVEQAAKYSWAAYAERMVALYRQLV
ncbi:MAG: hypothetical protein AUG51_10330 [Acidobacteria bacterium 13_1_20CM_3_53_8]|nr:MAG: hypothetical protein AUG51_10330 [Acidobacteria bacterium 13_1_20CM_3_53_8]